jgi:hypothetical protein
MLFVIQIVGSADGRRYEFRTATPEEAARWVSALRNTMELLRLADSASSTTDV